eukprot:3267-Heterococcus_DN1.PRE.2
MEIAASTANKTATTLLAPFGGDITPVITTIGGKLLAPCIKADIVRRFGRGNGFHELHGHHI